MPTTTDAPSVTEIEQLVQSWLHKSTQYPVDPSAQRLAEVLRDPRGLDFTVGFVDGVVRPEDTRVAAHNLNRLTAITPKLLPWYLRSAIGVGGATAPIAPGVVIPVARRVLREMVGHLVLDATPAKLGPAMAKLRAGGNRLNLNLLGEAVLGSDEAARRLRGTAEFLARDDVDYVSIKVSSVISGLSMWAFDEAVAEVVSKLTPLYELAAAGASRGFDSPAARSTLTRPAGASRGFDSPAARSTLTQPASTSATPTLTQAASKFINLDMEEYRDLDLTIAVFKAILDQPQLRGLEAGIVLQTYLPDALGAMQDLQQWASARVAAGGAPIKVRVVKGANLAMEHVDAAMHDWPLATYDTKQDSDTNYKRVLDWALTPERTANVKLGVAGHNLFDVAHSFLLAQNRGVTDAVEYEMLLGMATGQAEAVRQDVGNLLLYTPVVNPSEFDVAIAYLIRRLEENSSSENFMSAVFELDANPQLFAREKARYEASVLALAGQPEPTPHRAQNRQTEVLGGGHGAQTQEPGSADAENGRDGAALPEFGQESGAAGFRNTPDTDPALAPNRAWGRAILSRSASSDLGVQTIAANRIENPEQLGVVFETVRTAARAWAARPAAERAAILHRAGDELAKSRADLLEVMAAEAGKTIAEGDPEVSEAIDFAHYYAERGLDLERVDGAAFVPAQLTVVTPPWNFPVAIPAGGVLAALAAGSGVVIKPAKLTQRSGAVMVEALWRAGVPRELLALVDVANRELGTMLVSDPSVDRVILTGAYETAELFRSFRADLPLLAETSGKNAIIVTPSADLDLAASDVVKSAFGHAGQKCSAASLVILVGTVGRSKRFARQFVDAVTSLRVGYPQDPNTQMGPVVEPAQGKLLEALTTLEPGETWLVKPEQLDESGKLFSPAVKDGVRPGSKTHLTEFFGPVLGIMRANTLEEAIALQNAVDYGLTAGLHSLDSDEVRLWLSRVEAGNLYVNRGITGAIVQRQPFGGWKKSAVGPGAKAGGPNYLIGLGSWQKADVAAAASATSSNRAVADLVQAAETQLGAEEVVFVRASVAADDAAFADEFGVVKDVSQLGVERNLFRYLPADTTVRISAGASLADAARVLAAGLRSGAKVDVSTATPLPEPVAAVLKAQGVDISTVSDSAWPRELAKSDAPNRRIRLVGAQASDVTAVTAAPDIAIWDGEVTAAGRIELLPFLREQAIAITNHRFGNPTTLTDAVI